MASLKILAPADMAIKDNPGITTVPKGERAWTKFILELDGVVVLSEPAVNTQRIVNIYYDASSEELVIIYDD